MFISICLHIYIHRNFKKPCHPYERVIHTCVCVTCVTHINDLKYGGARVIESLVRVMQRNSTRHCSQMRSDCKYLGLQINRFSRFLFRVTRTPVYSSENLFVILETPVKTCLKFTGTPMKTCLKFWQS